MRKKTEALFLAAAAFFCAATLCADPQMPEGFKVDWSDSSGLTWRETGALPLPLKDAMEALGTALKKQGYEMRHDITGDAFGDMHLFLWIKGEEELTIMVWPEGDGGTGLSWGVTIAGQEMNSTTNNLQKAETNGKDK